jgi:hypothetical protein
MSLLKRYLSFLFGLMFYRPNAFPNVNLGSTPAQMGITGAVRKIVYDKVERDVDFTLDDIWATDLTNVIKPGKENQITPPQSEIFFQVASSEYGHSILIKAARDLQEAPIIGDNELPGTEENLRMLYGRLYFNTVSKAVATRGYGNEFKELEDVGAYANIPTKKRRFRTEYRGLQIRKAAVLEVEDILVDTFSSCTQRICSNVFVSNIHPENQPVYDITAPTPTDGAIDALGYYSARTFSGVSTFVENLGAKLVAASGLTASPVAYPTVYDIENFGFYLENIVKMQKIKIGSEYGYRLDLNPWAYKYLARFDGELSTKMTQAHDFCDASGRMKWPGLVGQIGNVFIFKDSRGPTLTLSGSAGTYGVQFGWVNPGNNDDRNASPWAITSGSENLVYDVNICYGAGGLCERVVMSAKDLNEIQSYGYRKGSAFVEQRGIQTVKWNTDAANEANLIQRNIALFITSRPSSATLRATS